MPATWTTPITWNVDQLVTNNDLNEQLRDNLEYLLNPNKQLIQRDNGGNYSISSVTSFEDIDSTNLSISLTTHGGPVLVTFMCSVVLQTGELVAFDIAVDGTRVASSFSYGLFHINNVSGGTVTFMVPIAKLLVLDAGTYTIRPQWRTNSGDTPDIVSVSTNNPVTFEAIEL